MPYINQPPDLFQTFQQIYDRLRKLETAVRFTNPNVDFATNTPTNPRTGDQYFDTDAELLKYWNGTDWIEIADNNLATSLQTVNSNSSIFGIFILNNVASRKYKCECVRVGWVIRRTYLRIISIK